MSDTPRTDGVALWAEYHREAFLDFARKLERENTALRADIERHVKIAADLVNENAALRADAERYWWLREYLNNNDTHVRFVGEPMSLEQFDAAIDAARKEKP